MDKGIYKMVLEPARHARLLERRPHPLGYHGSPWHTVRVFFLPLKSSGDFPSNRQPGTSIAEVSTTALCVTPGQERKGSGKHRCLGLASILSFRKCLWNTSYSKFLVQSPHSQKVRPLAWLLSAGRSVLP